ncbi:MAG: putative hydratase/decarboxylase family protein [Rubritepida sp.]|nr:putative hydratase/decarboxylase family protein [Rubritepida sp.]
MDQTRIAEAAAVLTTARKSHSRIASLPAGSNPRNVAEAHAIQDAVTSALGAEVGAFKANAPASATLEYTGKQPTLAPGVEMSDGVRGLIYAKDIHPSPAVMPSKEMPQCGIEGEIAFRFRHDLPPGPEPYTRHEVAAAADICVTLEVVSSRFSDPASASVLDKLADNISNGGLVHGEVRTGWQGQDLGQIGVTLTVNGEIVLDKKGGHPIGDPLGVAVVLVNLMRETVGVTTGQIATCGSYTGLRYVKPGDSCHVVFHGLGEAELTFTP